MAIIRVNLSTFSMQIASLIPFTSINVYSNMVFLCSWSQTWDRLIHAHFCQVWKQKISKLLLCKSTSRILCKACQPYRIHGIWDVINFLSKFLNFLDLIMLNAPIFQLEELEELP